MSALEQLIRLYRWRLDEQRRHLADVEALAATLEQQRRRLDAEEGGQHPLAGDSGEAVPAPSAYARQLIERRRKLAQSEAEAAEQVAKARAALAEALEEMKRYEIAVANRLRHAKRRQQQATDETGAGRVRRGRRSR